MAEITGFPEQVENTEPVTLESIPSIQVKPAVKSDDIFYSAVLTPGNPVNNWSQAKEEVARTGESSLVTQAEERWKQEQDDSAKEVLLSLVNDPSVSTSQKQAVLSTYIAGGFVQQSLRDKYLTKQATADRSITEMDRKAQDIYAETVFARDNQKKAQAGAKLIEDAENDFSAALAGKSFIGRTIEAGKQIVRNMFGDVVATNKAAGSVASGVALSIPAGLLGAFSIIKDQDPAKATEIIKKVQEYAYAPDEAKAQQVTNLIQTTMEILDIPFQWMGDQVLDVTGSPGAATAVYTTGQVVGYVGAYAGAKAGIRAVRQGRPAVDPTSPAGATDAANKEFAVDYGVAAVVDESGQMAEALRAKKETLISDWMLPKLEEEYGTIRPDLRTAIEKQDKILSGLYREAEFDPNVAPVTQLVTEREAYLKVLDETSGPQLLLSSSVVEPNIVKSTVNELSAKLVFGRNDKFGYGTVDEAGYALDQLLDNTKHLPDPGVAKIIEREGQYFLEWQFKREYKPWEHLTFGADALSAHILHPKWDVTKFANSWLGEKIWPAYMRMTQWVPSVGQQAGWQEARIESKFLRTQRELVMGTDNPKELSSLLRKGEDEGKQWTAQDVQVMHQHLTKAQAEKLHSEYVGYRRIEDHLYRFADRKFRHDLDTDGFKTLYDKEGTRLGFASDKVDPTGVKSVWDITKQAVVEVTPEMQLIRLREPVRAGNQLYRHAVMDGNLQLGPIKEGSLTRIPGYISRHYDEWFVLDKIPKSLSVDGVKVAEKDLRNYKAAVAMGKTQKEIEKLKARLDEENPDNTYEWRKEEKDIQDKIIHDSKVYDTYLKEKHKRGERLPAFGREADVEDVLVAQTRSIQSVSRVTAWDQVMQAYRTNWLKAYGDFSDGVWPDQINRIRPKPHMSPEEESRFLAAQKIYSQIEMQQFSSLPSDMAWRAGLHTTADLFEKMPVDASILREWGEKGMVPVKAVKALGSNLWLYLRFPRMWLVQPQQWKELLGVTPSFAKEMQNVLPIWNGMLHLSATLNPMKSLADNIGRRTVKDYDNIIAAMERTGIMQAVDTNQMIHGIWKDALKELDPKSSGAISDLVKGTAGGMGKVLAAGPKIGRAIGYDPAELMNQITLWLYAKHRFELDNPNVNWNTPENVAKISQAAGRYGHMSSTRAGMYSWQEGMVSMFTQFAAIPFKSFMQMLSAKEFTASEKARLAGARLFWYGKYGVPGGALIYETLTRGITDEDDREKLEMWTNGVYDKIMNETLHALFDASGQKTNLNISGSTSTVPDTIWFWDLGKSLFDFATGDKTTPHKFPFMNATDSVFKSVRTIYDMFTVLPESGEEKEWGKITWEAVSFAGVLNDYAKSQVAEQISKSGTKLGYVQTGGEAVGRLWGLTPRGEQVLWENKRDEGKREKYIQETAKTIHERLMSLRGKVGEEPEQYLNRMQAYLSRVDPAFKDELIEAILKEDRKTHQTLRDSMLLYYYKHYSAESDKQLLDMRNRMVTTQDPEMKALLYDLENLPSNNKQKQQEQEQ